MTNITNGLRQLLSAKEMIAVELEDRAYLLMFTYLVRIEKAMKQKNWKKKDLAEAVGVSKSYISKIFRADKLTNFRILAKMERALGLNFLQPDNDNYRDPLTEIASTSEVFKNSASGLQLNEGLWALSSSYSKQAMTATESIKVA